MTGEAMRHGYRMHPGDLMLYRVEIPYEVGATAETAREVLGTDRMEVLAASGWLRQVVPNANGVLFVREWGASEPDQKVNWRAWGFYGFSPIVGPVFMSPDSTEDGLPGEWDPRAVERIEAEYLTGGEVHRMLVAAQERLLGIGEFEWLEGRWS